MNLKLQKFSAKSAYYTVSENWLTPWAARRLCASDPWSPAVRPRYPPTKLLWREAPENPKSSDSAHKTAKGNAPHKKNEFSNEQFCFIRYNIFKVSKLKFSKAKIKDETFFLWKFKWSIKYINSKILLKNGAFFSRVSFHLSRILIQYPIPKYWRVTEKDYLSSSENFISVVSVQYD